MASRNTSRPSVCHYELFGVSRDAPVDEIKKRYRALALQWHPDKNRENVEEATLKFKEVQSAWEVLSNDQERAWYDSHREQILRGHVVGADATDAEAEALDLQQYMSVSCFEGFGDDEGGFFAVYAHIFEAIDAIERKAAADSGEKRSQQVSAPCFGDSLAPVSQVRQFYSHWSNFTSVC